MPAPENAMLGIATFITRTHEGEESKIMISSGSIEELNAYLTESGHLCHSIPFYVKMNIGPPVQQVEEEKPKIIIPN